MKGFEKIRPRKWEMRAKKLRAKWRKNGIRNYN